MTASYSLRIRRSAEKELRALPKSVLVKVVKRIQRLTNDPHPQGSQKLSGQPYYRIRQGDYRILYALDDAGRLIEIVRIAHRREAYR